MLNLRQSAIALITLSSGLAFAGTMGPACQPGNVTVPCEQRAWDFGLQALYLQPSFNNQGGNFLGQYVLPTASSTTNTLVDNDIKWGWGFKIEGSYHFNTGNDINVNWYHLNDNSRSRSFPVNFAGTGLLASNNEIYTASPRWDAVNAEFGQHIDVGQHKNIRFHGGVQYARLESNIGFVGMNDAAPGYSYAQTSEFKGFGPRTGVDFMYDLGKGLNVYLDTAGAILAGSSKYNTVINSSLNAYVQALPATNGSRTTIVPELEGKLGLKYNYPMAQGQLVLDAGYMWVNYFSALTTISRDDSDYGIQGPYFGMKWIGSLV